MTAAFAANREPGQQPIGLQAAHACKGARKNDQGLPITELIIPRRDAIIRRRRDVMRPRRLPLPSASRGLWRGSRLAVFTRHRRCQPEASPRARKRGWCLRAAQRGVRHADAQPPAFVLASCPELQGSVFTTRTMSKAAAAAALAALLLLVACAGTSATSIGLPLPAEDPVEVVTAPSDAARHAAVRPVAMTLPSQAVRDAALNKPPPPPCKKERLREILRGARRRQQQAAVHRAPRPAPLAPAGAARSCVPPFKLPPLPQGQAFLRSAWCKCWPTVGTAPPA